jgi:hypothetical protein
MGLPAPCSKVVSFYLFDNSLSRVGLQVSLRKNFSRIIKAFKSHVVRAGFGATFQDSIFRALCLLDWSRRYAGRRRDPSLTSQYHPRKRMDQVFNLSGVFVPSADAGGTDFLARRGELQSHHQSLELKPGLFKIFFSPTPSTQLLFSMFACESGACSVDLFRTFSDFGEH